MEIIDIIRNSFEFPNNNIKELAIFIVISIIASILTWGGLILSSLTLINGVYGAIALILFIIAIVVYCILYGYQINIIKSGIENNEKAPIFNWMENIIDGIKAIVINIVYMIIPSIITIFVALITNLPNTFMEIMWYTTGDTDILLFLDYLPTSYNFVPEHIMIDFMASSIITMIVFMIIFIIFSFALIMGSSRFANTGNLTQSLNIPEAFRDLLRIGLFKIIATVVILVIVILIVNFVLTGIYSIIPILSFISLIIIPYFNFVFNRAYGLLYSDIA